MKAKTKTKTTTNRPEYLIQGELQITPRAEATLHPADVWHALRRHTRGDWGDAHELCERANAEALAQGREVLSLYHDRQGRYFCIVTAADRATTTVTLLAE